MEKDKARGYRAGSSLKRFWRGSDLAERQKKSLLPMVFRDQSTDKLSKLRYGKSVKESNLLRLGFPGSDFERGSDGNSVQRYLHITGGVGKIVKERIHPSTISPC